VTTSDVEETADASLLRHSRVMAAGTIVSRATGFLRTAVIAAAIGPFLVGDAYNIANTTPNIIYELLLGGVLTSVVVPLLVHAARQDGDNGESYAQRLLTLVIVVLGAASIVAVVLGPQIVDLYGNWATPDERELAALFSRFFLPQILFYGVGAMIGAILNARDRFAAPMWAPVLNNLVVITTGLLFLAVTTGRPEPGALSRGSELLLAIGTTAGVVVQTIALLPSLRRSGFRFRMRFDFRHSRLREASRMAGWVLVYVIANQLGYLVIVRLASSAARVGVSGTPSGFSPYQYAFMLFSLPHAIVTVSVVTALLPRMSRHADVGRREEVRADVSRGLRLSASLLVPAAVAFIVLGPQIGIAVFGYGNTTVHDAHFIGLVLAAFAVGLVPFSFFQLELRAFYAVRDTRTPAVLNIWVNIVNVAVDIGLYLVLPDRWRVIGLAVGYSVSYAVGLGLMTGALHDRIGGVDGRHVTQTTVRLFVAAVPAGLLAAGAVAGSRAVLGTGRAGAYVALLSAVLLGGVAFVTAARQMHIRELDEMLGLARSRV
jgi:putative peptidoglycan lipid II flippase